MTNQPPSDLPSLTPVFCQNQECREMLGLATDDGELVICAIVLAYGRFRCHKCGTPKTWSHTDAQLSRLLEKVKRE